MDDEYQKYDEIWDETFRGHAERIFKVSYRRNWVIVDIVRLNNGKWLLKWEKQITHKGK